MVPHLLSFYFLNLFSVEGIEMTDVLRIFLRKCLMIVAVSFKFNDCVGGEVKAAYLVNFLLKPVKCVTGLSKGSLFSQC